MTSGTGPTFQRVGLALAQQRSVRICVARHHHAITLAWPYRLQPAAPDCTPAVYSITMPPGLQVAFLTSSNWPTWKRQFKTAMVDKMLWAAFNPNEQQYPQRVRKAIASSKKAEIKSLSDTEESGRDPCACQHGRPRLQLTAMHIT